MNSATPPVRIWEAAKNDAMGRRVGTRVFVASTDTAAALALRNDLVAAERLSGAPARFVMKGGKFNTWHETYSESAGYPWGRSTGWKIAGYEVLS